MSLLFKLHLYLAMAYSLCHFLHTCIPQECGLPCVYKCHAPVSFQQFASLPSDTTATMKVLLLLAVLPLAWAQFPAACNNEESLNNKRCCPNECGSHGTCTNIATEFSIETSWNTADTTIVDLVRNMTPQDVRYQWPTRVFEQACVCDAKWGGYDCSECDFGYVPNGDGTECVENTNQLLVRRNFRTLTDKQKREYIMVLNESKNEAESDKKWAVVIKEPNENGGKFKLQNVATYDMFVVHHFLAAREKDNNACKLQIKCKNEDEDEIDFAHEGPAFLTWHRYYLLIVERELHRVAKRIGVNDFNLAYWDWTPEGTNVFTNARFGTPEFRSTPVNVTGSLFDEWPVLFNEHYREYLAQETGKTDLADCSTVRAVRDINEDRKSNNHLKRGSICNRTETGSHFLPRDNSISMALLATKYADDSKPGFNKRLEGFADLCDSNSPTCIGGTKGAHNNLHNAVHIYLSGHMRDVATASNDPIFFLHHANIDRIFEAWLRKFNGNLPPYLPMTGEHPGHNFNDTLVPFFPLKTNGDMYKTSTQLGFTYDEVPNINTGVKDGMCSNNMCNKGGYPPSLSSTPPMCHEFKCPNKSSETPNSEISNFRVPLHLIVTAGTFVVLMVPNIFGM